VRILIIVDCYYPTTKSSAKLVHDLGVEFVRLGHEVIVLAPSNTIEQKLEVSTEDGLRITRVRTGKIKGANLAMRGWQEMRLSRNLWNGVGKFLRSNPCDLIIFYSPSIFFGALVARLKRLWCCPSYLILRDIFPRWALDAGTLRQGFLYQYFQRKELQQYEAASVIGVQTPANLQYFSEELPGKKCRLEVLFNWAALDEPGIKSANHRVQLGLQGKVVFFFGGNIGVAQDMDNIVRLAEALAEHHDAFFLLIGEGSEVERLKSDIAAKGLANVRILPAVGQQEYLAMLSEFDVGLISLDRRLTTQNVPGKLLGYMQFSKPVLASLNPGNDLKGILEEAGSGFSLMNGDDAGLREAALRLLNEPELRRRMGDNSRRLLEKTFSSAAAAEQILRAASTAKGAAKE
jgi:O26-antigen biosynthesis N-acetyl-L-fucosamine transferase